MKSIKERKDEDISHVRLATKSRGKCLQLMHVGPYDQIGGTYEQLFEHAEVEGLGFNPPCCEVYISDPRRVAPEKLKTIARILVKRKK